MAKKTDADHTALKTAVLVVAESPEDSSGLDSALASRGYEFLRVDDPEDGLSIARQCVPDLVLIDLPSSDTDGLSVIQALRGHALTQSIPVLLVLGGNFPDKRSNALEFGADDCMSRPYDLNELLSRIAALLRRTLPLTAHRKSQANLVSYLAGHFERRKYEVYSPFLRSKLPAPPEWKGPAPDLAIVRKEKTVAVAAETIQSLLREDTPDRWLAYLENDIAGLRIFVRDRESERVAKRIRKALDLPFQISRVGRRPSHLQTPRLRRFRIRRKQRQALVIGGVILILGFGVGAGRPIGRLSHFGNRVLAWFINQAKHYRPKSIERQLLEEAKTKGKELGEKRKSAVRRAVRGQRR